MPIHISSRTALQKHLCIHGGWICVNLSKYQDQFSHTMYMRKWKQMVIFNIHRINNTIHVAWSSLSSQCYSGFQKTFYYRFHYRSIAGRDPQKFQQAFNPLHAIYRLDRLWVPLKLKKFAHWWSVTTEFLSTCGINVM